MIKRRHAFSRREFLRATGLGAAGISLLPTARVWGNGADQYEGPLLVTLQLDGGADVTQLCDPKTNTPGELKLTTGLIPMRCNRSVIYSSRQSPITPSYSTVTAQIRWSLTEWILRRIPMTQVVCTTGQGAMQRASLLSLPCMPPIMRPISRWPIRFMAGSLVPQE